MPSISTWNRLDTMQWRLKCISGQICRFQYIPRLFVWVMASDERILFLTGTGYFDFFSSWFHYCVWFSLIHYFRNVCNLSIWFKSNHSFFLLFVYITSLPWWPFDVWVLFTCTSDFQVLLFTLLFMSSVMIIRTELRFSRSVAFHFEGFWQLSFRCKYVSHVIFSLNLQDSIN